MAIAACKCIAEPAMTPDALTARLQELLELKEPGCDCPRCDVAEYQRALAEHLIASGNRRRHLRVAWENPAPRAPKLSDG